jgi:hypothetical protein
MSSTLNRITPWVVTLINLVFLEQIIKTPKQVYWLGFLALTLIFLAIWQLTGRQLLSKKFWRFAITPTFLFLSGLLFLVFLEAGWLKQLFIFSLSIFGGVFLEVVFVWFWRRPRYQPNALENISTHLNLLTIFFTTSGLFGLIIFLNFPLWLLALIFFIISAILNYQLIWISDANWSTGWPYIVVITLTITEIFLAVSFLPTSIYVSGLLVTISYYLITGLTRNWLLGIKEGKVVKRYLIISLILLAMIFLTAKWF